MNTKGLLDQLLASGQAMLKQNLPTQGGAPRPGGISVSDFGKGALADGALIAGG